MGEDDWDEHADGDELSELHDPLSLAKGAEKAPTPGERLLYVLGQLYRLYRKGEFAIHPNDFDIEDLARIIGVLPEIEFVQENLLGHHYHFGAQVLHADPVQIFPWRLLGTWEWAAEQEFNSFWSEEGLE
jgi:hypothetical protein